MAQTQPTIRCPCCHQRNFASSLQCRRCNFPFVTTEEMKRRYKCGRCDGTYREIVQYPNRGAGSIIIVLGILLAPFLIGLFILFYGIRLKNETTSYLQCPKCGITLSRQVM